MEVRNSNCKPAGVGGSQVGGLELRDGSAGDPQ